MLIIIWLIAVIYFTNRIIHQLIKFDEESIQKTTYTKEIVVDGERKKIIQYKCPKCGNTRLCYKDAEKAEEAGFKLAVCPVCGT